ncbi:MAG: diaminopimelate epimerase [Aureispira sp.]|nr:diaminopimelate epimerase [Aureispira sp.]
MEYTFYKYQGTGNDFILIDNRDESFKQTDSGTIAKLCDRKFGIGADGLMLLQQKDGYDFEMIYFNSDGNTSSMCGNGGRCIVAFAYFLGAIGEQAHFLAIDGDHDAVLTSPDYVELKMGNVGDVEVQPDFYYLNTGSPHYIQYVEDLDDINIVEEGRNVRYNERFREEGTNVNFVVDQSDDSIEVATYERGVENETLSCGTGVTAAALTHYLRKKKQTKINIKAKGGNLIVKFKPNTNTSFEDIWLCGKAQQVFKGKIELF